MSHDDSSVSQESADRLHKEARRTTLIWTVVGLGLIGPSLSLIVLIPLLRFVGENAAEKSVMALFPVLSLATGGWVGWMIGRIKSVHMRVEAQQILLAMQFQRGTR